MGKHFQDIKEEWIPWNPTGIPEGDYVVTDFIQDEKGTKILIYDATTNVEVFFDGLPFLMRIAIEGIRIRTWGEAMENANNKSIFTNWFLFIVNNSRFTKWALEEGCGLYDMYDLTHYCIVTSQEVIDILATFQPSIRIIEGKTVFPLRS